MYKVTGSVYADPIASLFVAFMIMGMAYPLLRRSLRQLLDAAPERVDVQGVKEDIERLAGMGSVHDLRIWSLGEYTANLGSSRTAQRLGAGSKRQACLQSRRQEHHGITPPQCS